MKRKNATRSALVTSIISLLLCVSMLVSTTFAWFTDEVVSGNNVIAAGNLDIELYYQVEGQQDWTKVTENTNVFMENALWEPGHTEVVKLKVVNEGTLALKYQLGVNVAGETTSETAKGETIKLSDHIKFAVIDGEKDFSRDEAVAEAEKQNATKLSVAYNTKSIELLPKTATNTDNEDVVTMVVYMPTTVGNEANYGKGKPVPTINLGIELYATQMMEENDSFGPEYDAGAWVETMTVATEAELVTALNAAIGENVLISLANDIALTGTWTPVGDKDAGEYFTGTLDGNGYTISGLSVAEGDYVSLISAAKDATIKNLTVEGTVSGENAAGIVARIEGETVIENCVSNVAVAGTSKAGGIVSNVTGANAQIIDCVNKGAVSCDNTQVGGVGGIVGYVNNNAYVEIINCANEGTVTGTDGKTTGAVIGWAAGESAGLIAGFKNSGSVTGSNYKDTNDQLNRWIEDKDGTVLAGYCATPANWVKAIAIGTADELAALSETRISGTYVLAADIDMGGAEFSAMIVNRSQSATFIGNGHTISNMKLVSGADDNTTGQASVFYAYSSATLNVSDLTIKDVTVISDANDSGYAAAVIGYCEGAAVLNNVDVVNANITGAKSSGLLVGHLSGTLSATDCDLSGTVTVSDYEADGHYAGKYIGTMAGPATLTDCTANVTLSGNLHAKNIGDIYGRSVSGSLALSIKEGETVDLLAKDYGTVTLGTAKNVVINGTEGTTVIFKTDANTKLENVTIKSAGFAYTGATADCGIVIDANAQIDNLVVEGCTFTGTGAKAGRGLSGLNDNASIVLKNCTFKDMGYPIYAWGGYEALTIEGCTFENIKSWAIMPQSGFDGDLTVTGCTFKDCLGGGLIKAGTLTAGHTFTFTNNTVTGCTVAGDHNWFQFNTSAGTTVISGNTMDGTAWTPGVADGLK